MTASGKKAEDVRDASLIGLSPLALTGSYGQREEANIHAIVGAASVGAGQVFQRVLPRSGRIPSRGRAAFGPSGWAASEKVSFSGNRIRLDSAWKADGRN